MMSWYENDEAMHGWCKFVCHEHQEVIDGYLDTPNGTAVYLKSWHSQISEWLNKHFACDVHLVSKNTDTYEKLFECNYRFVSNEWSGSLWPPEFYSKLGITNMIELEEYDKNNGYYDGYYGDFGEDIVW